MATKPALHVISGSGASQATSHASDLGPIGKLLVECANDHAMSTADAADLEEAVIVARNHGILPYDMGELRRAIGNAYEAVGKRKIGEHGESLLPSAKRMTLEEIQHAHVRVKEL